MNTETGIRESRIELGKLVFSRAGLVLEFARVVVFDWDIAAPHPETGLVPANGTIAHRGEVYERLGAERGLWAVYSTRNGVRAILLSEAFSIHDQQANGIIGRLQPDPLYIQHSRRRNSWTARVSRKPGRAGEDRIEFVGLLGNGDMLPPLHKALLLHHQLLLVNGVTTTRLPLHIVQLLGSRQYQHVDLSHLLSEAERQPVLNPTPRSGGSPSFYQEEPFIPDPEDPLFQGFGPIPADEGIFESQRVVKVGVDNGPNDGSFEDIPF